MSRPQARHRRSLIRTYGYVCHLCGGDIPPDVPEYHPLEFTIDHLIPRSRGGRNCLSNLRPAHRQCNETKADRIGWRSISSGITSGVAV